MAVILDPADFSVFADDPVFHEIQISLTFLYLIGDRGRDLLVIIRMYHAAESKAGQFLEFFQAAASEQVNDSLVGIQQFSFFIGLIDKESARHVVAELLDHCQDLLCHQLLVRLPYRQNGDSDSHGPVDRVDGDPARK